MPVLLACDHACPRVPAALGDLGLARPEFSRHIAFDIGAADLTRILAGLLEVPAILSGYSRLVVDCNRHLHDPSAFPEISDGVVIPGNRALNAEARTDRVAALYRPYHDAIASALDDLGPAPGLIAVHSFTPRLDGFVRPWHVGILWDRDDRLAVPLLGALRADGRLCVGDNEPYSGRHPSGYTMDTHAEARGLPHVSIEVRQDLLATPDGISHWATLLASALRPILHGRFGAAAHPDVPTPDGSQ
ncbi:MAG: N-formylglutamate amidohydrolase [Gammaproteobacteria bacterium]